MINRFHKEQVNKIKAVQIAKEIESWMASHPMAQWQRQRCKEIRAVYESKIKQLERAHDIAATQVAEDFAQFELDFLKASHEFRQDNPNKEWHPEGAAGLLTKAFWRNFAHEAKELGVNILNNGKASN